MAERRESGPSTESKVVEDLIYVAAKGDRRAQEELLTRYWATISAAVRTRRHKMGWVLQSREQEDDLSQDVAIHLLREFGKHKWRGRESFIAWIKEIARTKILDAKAYHEAAKRNAASETAVDKPGRALPNRTRSPESKIDALRDVDDLESKLSKLDDKYASAVRLHGMGYSHVEIGDACGCEPDAARKRVARGLRKLAEM